jgi:hypothetical protein
VVLANNFVPPDFSILEDGDGEEEIQQRKFPPPPDFTVLEDDGDEQTYVPPDYTIEEEEETAASRSSTVPSKGSYDDDDEDGADGWYEEARPASRRPDEVIRRSAVAEGASWKERNAKFAGEQENEGEDFAGRDGRKRRNAGSGDGSNRSFRRGFRGTRVFVQGLPPHATWQDVKDHFRVAGEVAFASVSSDPVTGESKGHGIVQYETTEQATNAIAIMRNHPLDGYQLYIREDVQEKQGDAQLRTTKKGPTPPTKWKCANEENAAHLPDDQRRAILQLIKARDSARIRRNYEAADKMREELKHEYGVHVDDRLKMWWTAAEGGSPVPDTIRDIRGEGGWGPKRPWRQIPTTPENDACVDPNLVYGLLEQRDIARKEKDFRTADTLLEEARTAPDGDLYLRIHDESRTWRIWTPEPPPRPVQHQMTPAEQCIELVERVAPDKTDEVRTLLEKFPGREYNILKKLKQRYADRM